MVKWIEYRLVVLANPGSIPTTNTCFPFLFGTRWQDGTSHDNCMAIPELYCIKNSLASIAVEISARYGQKISFKNLEIATKGECSGIILTCSIFKEPQP